MPSISIRRKTLIIIGLTLLCLPIALYAISSPILLNGFARVEEQNAHTDVRRVRGALDDTLAKLDATASDWANWDDTYRYVIDKNPSYARANLRTGSISILNVNLMILLRPSGEIVYGTGFDAAKGTLTPLPTGIYQHLKAPSPLLRHDSPTGSKSGILMLLEGPTLIVSRPILTSEKLGPSHGTLIFGRYLDQKELKRLAQLTDFPLELKQFKTSVLPPDYEATRSELSRSTPVAIQPISSSTLAGYTLLSDIYNQPALILRLAIPRDVYRQGRTTLLYLFASLFVVCLLFSAVTMLLLEKLVLRRLQSLSNDVRAITAEGDISHRVRSIGFDELGMLGDAVNNLLQTVERSHHNLEESEMRFRAFMDNSPAAAFMKDTEGRLLYVNATLERLFQKSGAELVGKTDEQLWPHDVAHRIRQNDLSVLQANAAMQFEEIVPIAAGQETCWMSFKFPFRDASGSMVLAGMAIDITERKAVERMKGEFISTVSHELRTPLTSIKGALGLIRGGVAGGVSDQSKQLLELASKNVDRLGRIIDNILDIEKLTSGETTMSIQPISIMPLIESALETTSSYAQEFSVNFSIESSLPEAMVSVDSASLTQVLTNLLSNAVKFSTRGGSVLVDVTRLESREKKPLVRVAITNMGPSIPSHFHNRIFEKFAQADSSDSRQKGGAGLGLSISHAILERLGGHIGFDSDDKGTTFYFDLPEYRRRSTAGSAILEPVGARTKSRIDTL